jgi:hypothetical protein
MADDADDAAKVELLSVKVRGVVVYRPGMTKEEVIAAVDRAFEKDEERPQRSHRHRGEE